MADRETSIVSFLTKNGWAGATRRTLADDASFRRYERLRDADRTAILMDAPPAKEDVRPFLAIDGVLRELELSAPKVYAQDLKTGLLLLEDLGDDTYTRVLSERPEQEEMLYNLAVDTLIALHRRFDGGPGTPRYDDARLLAETDLLLDWYLPAVTGAAVAKADRREFSDLWRRAFARTRAVPDTLVLRDYHVDNLMWLPKRAKVEACGLLDFQDAVIGPVTYDLVSLLEDARRDVPPDLASRAIQRYLDAFPEVDPNAFRTSYAILGAQRSTKILGVFTRLDRRDGKPDYLVHVPRVWRWLEADLTHPALEGVCGWFDRMLPSDLRRLPERTIPRR